MGTGVEAFNLLAMIGALLAAAVASATFGAIIRQRTVEKLRYERVLTALDCAHDESDADKALKRNKINALRQRGPKTFSYLNETIVNDLYPQIASAVRAESIEAVETGASEASIGAELHAVTVGLGKKRTRETRTKYAVAQHVPNMYNQLEDHLVGRSMCSVILDEHAGGDAVADDLAQLRQLMRDRFHYEIPSELQEQYLVDSRCEAAKRAIGEMAGYSGYVIAQARVYQLRKDEATITLRYRHPANDDLKADEKPLFIDLVCDKGFLRDSGEQAFARTDEATVIALGKVIGIDKGPGGPALVIAPIAIY